MISPVVKSRPCMTGGIQKCIGAKPTFNASAIVASVMAIGCVRQ